MLSWFSHVQLCKPMHCSLPDSSLHGDYLGKHWSGLLFPTPGNLSDPGIQPVSFASPALAGRFFTTAPPG